VGQAFGDWHTMLAHRGLDMPPPPHAWTAEQALDAIRAWAAATGTAPRFADWDAKSRAHQAARGVRDTAQLEGVGTLWPSSQTVKRLFGTMDLAARAAGLEPAPPAPRERWTPDRVTDAVRRWHATHHRVPTAGDWTPSQLRKSGDQPGLARWQAGDWPIIQVVRERFGTLDDAIRAAGLEPTTPVLVRAGHASDRWTAEVVLDAIRRWALAHDGVPPSVDDTRTHSTRALADAPDEQVRLVLPTVPVAKQHFGSWRGAIRAAGLEPRRPSQTRRSSEHGPDAWSRERIVQRIHRWVDAHDGQRPPERAFFTPDPADPVPSRETVKRHFGSWSHAKRAAGHTPGQWQVSWQPDQILDAIRHWHHLHQRPPTTSDWSSLTTMRAAGPDTAPAGTTRQPWPSAAVVQRTFGSFSAALRAAGMEPATTRWTGPDHVLEALRAFGAVTGRPPTMSELGKRSNPDPATGTALPCMPGPKIVRQHFGTIEAACKAAGLGPTRKWDRDRIVTAIQDWAARHGRAPLRREWIATRRDQPDLPSEDAVRYVLGRWDDAMRLCGLKPTPDERRRTT
jgi:hypothetical protein